MISLFTDLLDGLVCFIRTAIYTAVNDVVAAVAAAVQALLDALPDFPAFPTVPSAISDGFGFFAYLFPVDFIVTETTIFLTLTLAWFGFAILLRWGKVLRGGA